MQTDPESTTNSDILESPMSKNTWLADTDSPTLSDAHRAVMERIFGFVTVGLVPSPYTPLD